MMRQMQTSSKFSSCSRSLVFCLRKGKRVTHDRLLSIVFIHGITGHRENTWAVPGSRPWPEKLLPEKMPQARILSFGYDAGVVGWRSKLSGNRIGDHAKNLLSALAAHREVDDTVCSLFSFSCPIVTYRFRVVRMTDQCCLSATAWAVWSVKMHSCRPRPALKDTCNKFSNALEGFSSSGHLTMVPAWLLLGRG
jgi:hypothetical protein